MNGMSVGVCLREIERECMNEQNTTTAAASIFCDLQRFVAKQTKICGSAALIGGKSLFSFLFISF